jgi:tRNA-2-methylthio-N6-dimethylallyladenosine synthase
MTRKYLIETFGCQMNDLDSEKIAGSFHSDGMEATDDAAQADVIILNTCSVREKAVQKVYSRLGELRQYKARRPNLIIGVVGCMAQLDRINLLKGAPFVNILAGPQKGSVMSDLVRRSSLSQTPIVDMRRDEDPAPLETAQILRRHSRRASITVSEGCNRNCTYCVVPITRGKERNRESSKIIREAQDLVELGYVEILLLGQTVNSYIDRTAGNVTFAKLLRLLAGISGLKRIRFTSPHPSDFSDELLDVMVSCPQVCNQIHLPVQSGSNRILRAMRRGYSRESYLEIIEKIGNAGRPISISTDIIVGFPGESEPDFQDTLSLLDAVQYESAFSFKYSPRPHTASLDFPDDVSDEEKGRRLAILQERQGQIQHRRNEAYMGQIMEIMVEDKARTRFSLSGRTSNNKIVNFDGPDTLMGHFTNVKITGFSPNSLKGIWQNSQNHVLR